MRNIIILTISTTLTCCALMLQYPSYAPGLCTADWMLLRAKQEVKKAASHSPAADEAEQLCSSVFWLAAFASSQTLQHKYKMGGCTVISNISVKIKVTADLLYMHLYIIDIVSHSDASTFKRPEIIHLHFLCSLYIYSLTYMLGSVCWLLHVDSGEAGILELAQHRTKTLSHCQVWTFAYLIHLRPTDFPCSGQLCSLLNHTECCVINHITVE